MLRSRPNNFFRNSRPLERDIIYNLDIIDTMLIKDNPIALSWEMSKRGVPCLRCADSTNGIKWNIDIYKDNFLFVRVNNHYDNFDHIIKAINFIKANIRSTNHLNNNSILTEEI